MNRPLSHSKLYSMFQVRVGLWSLIKMDSFMVLATVYKIQSGTYIVRWDNAILRHHHHTRSKKNPFQRSLLKSTHIDQFLQWNSHYHIAVKYSVINTLTHRAKVVCTTPDLLRRETQHL